MNYIIVIILVIMSGIFSGLTLGYFSLDFAFSETRFDRMKSGLIKNYFDKKPQESLYRALTLGSAKFMYSFYDSSGQSSLSSKELKDAAFRKADDIRAS